MSEAAVSLGSNVGNRLGNIRGAVELIKKRVGIIENRSGVYETPPWGGVSQRRFLNACTTIVTELSPAELLVELKRIEREIGRVQREHWGPREIDIDILTYGDITFEDASLSIPHPLMRERAFVLLPLSDILPGWKHPKDGMTTKELLEKVDIGGICRITSL